MYGYLCEPWSRPVTGCCDLDALGVPPEVQTLAHEAASEALWLATGQQFGNCAVTLRPCRRDCLDAWPADVTWADGVLGSWGWPWPTLRDGVWFNLACGQCVGECACTSFSEVLLPDPVHEVTAVTVDGVALVQGVDWHLYDGQRLVRAGDEEWPTCQDWTVTGGPGAWTVEARFGGEVPALGTLAVDKYTCELAKACVGLDCDLPPYVTEVTRQGVRFTLDPSKLLQDGLTGVLLPDLFISRVNPRGLQDRARAYSPDVPLPRVQG